MEQDLLIKLKIDNEGFSAGIEEARKEGNKLIADLEKKNIFGKSLETAEDLKMALGLIAKVSKEISLENLNLDVLINDVKSLNKVINEAKKSMLTMKTGTEEFNSMEAIVESATRQVKALKDATKAAGATIKTEMRTSVQEVQNLVNKFGLTSTAAIEAAKRAGDLRDTVGDANDLINAFKPGAGFGAVTSAAGGVVSAFSAVQGAMNLINSDSKQVEQAILKVQSAMALSQGLQGLAEARDSFDILKVRAVAAFNSIKAAIGSTGIGLLVVALGTIVAYWDDIKEAITGVSGKIKENAELAKKDLELQDKLLSSLNDQDEILKAQGFSERRILEIKRQKLLTIYETKKVDLQAILEVERAELQSTKRRRDSLFKYLGIYGQFFKDLDFFNVQKAQEDFDKVESESKASLIKIENEIAGYENNIRALDKKTNEEKRKEYDKTIEERKKKDKEYSDYLDTLEEEAAKKLFKQWEEEKKAQDDLDNYLEKSLEDNAKKQFESWENEKKNIESVGISIGDAYKRGYQTAEDNETELQKQREENIKKIQQAAAVGQQAYNLLSTALFNADNQRRQEELESLRQEQEEELRLAGDNEQKKDLIRQKFALKEREIKRKQAEADKKKAIMDATIGTAVAVIQSLPNFVLAAIAASLGAAQIALIAATPIPKFAKGVVSFDGKGGLVKGEGTGTSDSNLAYLSKGESVIPAAPTSANLGLINELVNGDVDSYINRHYVMPALQAKEGKANESYRHSMIEAENNLIARVSSHTLKSIHREQRNTTEAVKRLAINKDFKW